MTIGRSAAGSGPEIGLSFTEESITVLAPTRLIPANTLSELFPSLFDQAWHNGELDGWRPDEAGSYCPRCGATTGIGSIFLHGCVHCAKQSISWNRITRLGRYTHPTDTWVRAMKFNGQWRWAGWFGRRLADAVGKPFDPARVVVCPVPMHWTRRWWRGYNQATLMAGALAAARGWSLARVLRRRRLTPPQTVVPPSRRADNIRGSFDIEPVDLNGYEVVLVDDVKTSGATLHACSSLLRKAGARSIHAAVAAVADGQTSAP